MAIAVLVVGPSMDVVADGPGMKLTMPLLSTVAPWYPNMAGM